MQHGDHPRYFARVPGPSSFAGVLGDWLGTGFNALVASWTDGSGPATVKLVVSEWLCERAAVLGDGGRHRRRTETEAALRAQRTGAIQPRTVSAGTPQPTGDRSMTRPGQLRLDRPPGANDCFARHEGTELTI